MPKIPGTTKRVRRHRLKKIGWIVLSGLATLSLVAMTIAPSIALVGGF